MYTQRNEKIVKKGGSSSAINYSLLTIHSGMTLVELLVAVSIMVLLVAVSVPMFKPMLDSQKSAGGARTVALALQRARVLAMEDGTKSCGVAFDRFTEGNENNVSVVLRLLRNATDYTGVGYRVKVVNGNIRFFEFISGSWIDITGGSTSFEAEWDRNVRGGSSIRFGRQGRTYELDANNNRLLAAPFRNLYHPRDVDAAGDPLVHPVTGNPIFYPPVEFTVKQPPRPRLIPPVVMPRGTVVDMQHSGFGRTGRQFSFGNNQPSVNYPVAIMFLPTGAVDKYIFYNSSGALQEGIPRSPIHFCIGEWERAISLGHEDGRSNIQMASNFWVTVHPRTGAVRTSEMKPSANLDDARTFATEHFVNIGGF